MGLIRSIILDQINGPSDVATTLRLLLADRIDRPQDVEFENPDPKWRADDHRTNHRFVGDEASFIFTLNWSGAAYRVDVSNATLIEDEIAYAAIMPLIRKLGPVKALEKLKDDRESISDDEQALLDAWHKTKTSVQEGIARLETLHINDPAYWADLDDQGNPIAPAPPNGDAQVEPPTVDGDAPAATEIDDPELARLIDQYHATTDEDDRLETAAFAAHKRQEAARKALADYFAETQAERDSGGRLEHYRSILYRGRLYTLETIPGRANASGQPSYYVRYTEPHTLIGDNVPATVADAAETPTTIGETPSEVVRLEAAVVTSAD